MTSLTCDCNIDNIFLSDLQQKIDRVLAKKINKKLMSAKFDLNYCFQDDVYLKLVEYNNILERVKNCDSCFKDYKIEDIVSFIKNTLNKI